MNWDELKRRRGRFGISNFILEDECELVMGTMMPNFLIVRAEAQHMFDGIEYWAYSPLFDRCNDGQEIPCYKIWIQNGEVSAERCNYPFN